MKEILKGEESKGLLMGDLLSGVYDNFRKLGREIELSPQVEECPLGPDQVYQIDHKSAIILTNADKNNWAITFGISHRNYSGSFNCDCNVVAVPLSGEVKSDKKLCGEIRNTFKKNNLWMNLKLSGFYGFRDGRLNFVFPETERVNNNVANELFWSEIANYISKDSEGNKNNLYISTRLKSGSIKYSPKLINHFYTKFCGVLGL